MMLLMHMKTSVNVPNPDIQTYEYTIKAVKQASNYSKCLEIIEAMKSDGYDISENILKDVIDCCARAGRMDRALELLDSKDLPADQKIYTWMIKGFTVTQQLDRALALHTKMTAAGIESTISIYTALIECAVGNEQLEQAS